MGIEQDIWNELDIRERLQMSKNRFMVRLLLRPDEEEELEVPVALIKSVGRKYFEFKPSAIHILKFPISEVVEVEPLGDLRSI